MAENRTADQVRAEYLVKLGPDLGEAYYALVGEWSWLALKWREYEELFGGSQERVDLLNASAGLFFAILQRSLWEDALLHLCRLTDPPVMKARRNLSIGALAELCHGDPHDALRAKVEKLTESAVAKTQFARDWRNRRIAHTDLEVALDRAVQPLSTASRADVTTALRAIHAVLHCISQERLGADVGRDVIPEAETGTLALLYVIRDGLEAEAARAAMARRGELTQEQLRPRPL